jgi:hypothetical protein
VARCEPAANPAAGTDLGGCGGDGAEAWTALHHQGAATGLHAVEETPAGQRVTASVDAAGVLELLASPTTGPVECVVGLELASAFIEIQERIKFSLAGEDLLQPLFVLKGTIRQ